jgi:N-acetylmuramoyl-L-alanine amidase
MKSTLRRVAAFAAATTTAVSTLTLMLPVKAAQFGQQEVDQGKFVAVAAPVRGGSAHQLLVIEQLSNARPCWSESGSAPVAVDPLLVNFDFTGICGRSTDSNGYSIRVNGQDFGLKYSLRVVNRNGDLLLLGAPSDRTAKEIEIGRANGSTPGFTKLQLNNGWRFTKRTYDGRTLGHVYLTYEGDPVAIGLDPGEAGTPTPSRFRDTTNDIYAKEIEAAVQTGFIAGFAEDNTFRPQASLTREQLVAMVLEALNKLPNTTLNIPTQVVNKPYADVEASRWSAAKIQFARDNSIVSGYQDGRFRPGEPVTRAELIAVLRKASVYAQTLRGRQAQLEPKQPAFTFSDTASHWAGEGIREMSSYCGVASPLNEAGTAFYPDQAAQRNYAAAATLRMLNCVKGE